MQAALQGLRLAFYGADGWHMAEAAGVPGVSEGAFWDVSAKCASPCFGCRPVAIGSKAREAQPARAWRVDDSGAKSTYGRVLNAHSR